MSTPIGKGSRFRILTGDYRGREGVIVGGVSERPEWWRLDLGEGEIVEVSPSDLATLQRLSDAPAEVDPLFAELATLDAERIKAWGASEADDAARPIDEWLHFATVEIERADETIGDPEAGGDVVFRDAMMRAAMLCLAAVRVIDRSAT